MPAVACLLAAWAAAVVAQEKWEVELRGHLDRIAVTFAEYFSAIGCRGEMFVDIPELVADAAIVLKVAFREGEPMKVLSAKTQVRGAASSRGAGMACAWGRLGVYMRASVHGRHARTSRAYCLPATA